MLKKLIAPCGMNCSLCMYYQRDENTCMGCRGKGKKPVYCAKCVIVNCNHFVNTKSKYCYDCEKFPCKRIKQIDKRYRTKYHMSMIDNLNNIKEKGIEYFLIDEIKKWTCSNCGELVTVHRNSCLKCKAPYIIDEKNQ